MPSGAKPRDLKQPRLAQASAPQPAYGSEKSCERCAANPHRRQQERASPFLRYLCAT
jgi:hypothetical protein